MSGYQAKIERLETVLRLVKNPESEIEVVKKLVSLISDDPATTPVTAPAKVRDSADALCSYEYKQAFLFLMDQLNTYSRESCGDAYSILKDFSRFRERKGLTV